MGRMRSQLTGKAVVICHKLLRHLVPFALVGVLVSMSWLRHGMYELALVLQIVSYAMAILTGLCVELNVLSRLSNISLVFIVLNAAAVVALIYFITGRKAVWA
jgi:hypothetical protein